MMERVKEIVEILASENIAVDHEKKRRIYFKVEPGAIRELSRKLSNARLRLSTISAIENLRSFELLYHFSDDQTGYYFCPRVYSSLENPEVPSISDTISGASWIEREIHDLFGVNFPGHPDLKPLLKEDNEDIPEQPLRVKRREDHAD